MNLMDLVVKITCDDQASKEVDSTSSKLKSTLSSAAAFAGKAVVAGMGAAATGIAAISKTALDSYSDYEQLSGGVQKLFGDMADQVIANASQAYLTAGMSANDYMETVTGFSATLISSLGGDTEAAVDYADRALRQMSDNANTFGTDMESIQNAYSGFSKQNYTMLDNLKLGYGGTQEEMERLIADAAAMTDVQEQLGITVDASSMSFGNIINAIDVMQASLNIAGTTANEAAGTIEGSVNAMKGAWQNWLTSLGDSEADVTETTNALVESFVTAANNIIPRMEQIFTALIESLDVMLPQVLQLIVDYLPGIINTIVMFLAENLPLIVDAGTQLLSALIQGLPEVLTTIVGALPEIIDSILTFFIDNIPLIVNCGMQLLVALCEAMPEILGNIALRLPEIIDCIITTLLDNLPLLVEAGVKLFLGLIENLPAIIGGIVAAVPQIIASLINGFGNSVDEFVAMGGQLFQGFIDGILGSVWKAVQAIGDAIGSVISAGKRLLGIASPSKVFAGIGDFTMQGLAEGIEENDDPQEAMEQSMRDLEKSADMNFEAKYSANRPRFGDVNVRIDRFTNSGEQDDEELLRRIALKVNARVRGAGVYA